MMEPHSDLNGSVLTSDNDTSRLIVMGYNGSMPLGYNGSNVTLYPESNTTLSPLPPETQMSLVGYLLLKYVTPVIIFVGFIGNIMSLIVFMSTPLRNLSSSVYLSALAISDTAFLLQLFVAWLAYVGVYAFHMNGICQAGVYVSYVSSFLSVWLVIAFTVERYIVVCYPFRRHDMCTVKRAKIIVLALTIFSVVAYSFGAWTSGIINSTCTCLPRYENMVKTLNNVDTVVTLIIPCLTIFVMNTRIVYKISHFYERRASMSASHQLCEIPAPGSSNNRQRQQTSSRRSRIKLNGCLSQLNGSSNMSSRARTQIRITKLLLVISSVFLVLNLPSHAVRIYDFFIQVLSVEREYSPTLEDLQQYFTLMYYLNFSVNFFLYSFCGNNFRKAMFRIGLKCSHRIRRQYIRVAHIEIINK